MDLIYVATFVIALISSILSGLAGGGGGFITVPYWLLIGMTPAQSATTGGFMALGIGASSLAAFRKTEHMPTDRRLIAMLTAFTLICATIGAFILPHVETSSFKTILAVVTIFSLPLLFVKNKRLYTKKKHKTIGLALILIILMVSSVIISSAFSVLIAIILSTLFNMTILENTAVRRYIGLIQSGVIFSILAFQGNFLFLHAMLAIIGSSIGSYLGTKFAIKKGESFARYALVVGAFVSSVFLLVS